MKGSEEKVFYMSAFTADGVYHDAGDGHGQ